MFIEKGKYKEEIKNLPMIISKIVQTHHSVSFLYFLDNFFNMCYLRRWDWVNKKRP